MKEKIEGRTVSARSRMLAVGMVVPQSRLIRTREAPTGMEHKAIQGTKKKYKTQ